MANRTAPTRQRELDRYRFFLKDLDHHVGIDHLSEVRKTAKQLYL